MRLVIISGSIQRDNGSSRTATALQQAATGQGIEAEIVSIIPFDKLFIGDYIYFTTANSLQYQVMQSIARADALLFVVPTYFKTLPGSLKNFFDIVREKSLYEHKAVSFVASNHKNQDFGARQAQLVVQGILEFFETQAVFVPDIPIIDPAQIDLAVARRAIRELTSLHASYRPVV